MRSNMIKGTLQVLLMIFGLTSSPQGFATSVNVMAPLLIGDPFHPEDIKNQQAWQDYEYQLDQLKSAGVEGISTDIWWGLVEGEKPGQYNWSYYHKLANTIRRKNLKWIPILSFHQLGSANSNGGNIGDEGYMPLPKWVWNRYEIPQQDLNQNDKPATHQMLHYESADDLKFKSEQGNLSVESISVWATDLFLPDYKRFMSEFAIQFAEHAKNISEINISLGPAGELRYPSYNGHDQGSGYPSRGSLQAYSNPAIQSFQKFVLKKYKTIEALNKSWRFQLASFADVFPPNPQLLKNRFWENQEQYSNYGKDFFDWYNLSLSLHGRKILNLAAAVFEKTKMASASLGAKIPGVHWRIGTDRAAELAAGLVRTSEISGSTSSLRNLETLNSLQHFGYQGLLHTFKPRFGKMDFTLHFTALEMGDGDDGIWSNKPKTLVQNISDLAHAQGLRIKGENALDFKLSSSEAWSNMTDAVLNHGYSGLTFLRSNKIVGDDYRLQNLKQFITTTNTNLNNKNQCLRLF